MPKENLVITVTLPLPDDDIDKTALVYACAAKCKGEMDKLTPELGGKVEHHVEVAAKERGQTANGVTRTVTPRVKRTNEPAGTLPFQPPAPGVDQDAAA